MNNNSDVKINRLRKKVLQMVEVGYMEDYISRSYDVVNMFSVLINLTITFMFTFENAVAKYGSIMLSIELVTVLFFALDYVLRIWTAPLLFPDRKESAAIKKYLLSFSGIIDLLSFLPYFLPIFFPAGVVAFRMLRVARLFRLFRINAYYDSLNVITAVLKSRMQQLVSSVFILLILILAASLCMYSVENVAQPQVFDNAFSGIWWATSTLLTVGYGDIYPITIPGKILGIIITFLGCGMVAIPTGIISAGFVEQYTMLRESSNADRSSVNFIRIHISRGDSWSGLTISQLNLPSDVIVAAIQRNNDIVVPRGDVILNVGDDVLMATKSHDSQFTIELQELEITSFHPWADQLIKDLDISRQTFIIMVHRNGRSIVPKGDLKLRDGDIVSLYSKKKISSATKSYI